MTSAPADHAAADRPDALMRDRRARGTAEAMAEANERRRIEQELRHTLSHDGFVLHYQPRILLDSGRTIGGEALIRWPHRRRGMVGPGLFMPIAEGSALSTHIGGWVLRKACAEAATWPGNLRVSVNISARHLVDGGLLGHIADALQVSGLAAERLELEIPESALLEPNIDVLFALAAARDMGVGIVLDNFGIGFGSLTILRRVPFTAVKLDRSLIRTLPTDSDDVAVVHALLRVGQALGLGMAAQGIEAEAQRDFLVGLACEEGQGHLFSQAVSSADLRSRM